MASLDELLQVKGAVGALRFYDDGTLAEAVGDLPREHADLAAEMANATSTMMHQEADLFASYSGMRGWTPSEGWAMQGDQYSVWNLGNITCFVRNGEVSYNELYKALSRLAHR
jgi:roadblock/LC7 domain-containing protein